MDRRDPSGEPLGKMGSLRTNRASPFTIQTRASDLPSFGMAETGRGHVFQNVLRFQVVQQLLVDSIEHDWPEDRPSVRVLNKRDKRDPDDEPKSLIFQSAELGFEFTKPI